MRTILFLLLFFFSRESTHWFSTLCAVLPALLSSFFRAWKTEERRNSFFSIAFLLLCAFFFTRRYQQPRMHGSKRSFLLSLFLSLSIATLITTNQHYSRPRQCLTTTAITLLLNTRTDKCRKSLRREREREKKKRITIIDRLIDAKVKRINWMSKLFVIIFYIIHLERICHSHVDLSSW